MGGKKRQTQKSAGPGRRKDGGQNETGEVGEDIYEDEESSDLEWRKDIREIFNELYLNLIISILNYLFSLIIIKWANQVPAVAPSTHQSKAKCTKSQPSSRPPSSTKQVFSKLRREWVVLTSQTTPAFNQQAQKNLKVRSDPKGPSCSWVMELSV